MKHMQRGMEIHQVILSFIKEDKPTYLFLFVCVFVDSIFRESWRFCLY